jgi:RNA polymerase sigma-70 factor (ECF subfamily)
VAEFRRSPRIEVEVAGTSIMDTEIAPSDLIDRCRKGEPAAREQLFQRYRHYLWVLAQAQLGRYLRAKCDPSDIVQQTLLEVHRDFEQFAGTQEGELLAWMRQILAHNLYNETRRFAVQQRNAAREVSLEQLRAGLEHSSAVLGRCLVDDITSPSQAAAQREAAVRLADRMARLPEDYRTVLVLRVFEGLSAEEVAQRMNRSSGAVRMLQLRALTTLRAEMKQEE